jgi:hypothetical protein
MGCNTSQEQAAALQQLNESSENNRNNANAENQQNNGNEKNEKNNKNNSERKQKEKADVDNIIIDEDDVEAGKFILFIVIIKTEKFFFLRVKLLCNG